MAVVPFSCRMLGHVMRVEDPSRGLLAPRVCKRNGCTHREAGLTWPEDDALRLDGAALVDSGIKIPPPPCRCIDGVPTEGAVARVEDCPKHGGEYRKHFDSILRGDGPVSLYVPEPPRTLASVPPKPRRETKFTVSIYCGNCRTVGDYQFRKGTILHAANDFTWAEYRNGTPTDRKATIRLNNRTNGTLVECRFCKCSTALTIRERNGETA